jgi:CxxC-x17-CxxC domain-containing protein
MDYEDKNLTCKDCSKEFVWSAGEQKFYADKGLQNPPGRCPDCRKQKKEQKTNRQMFSIICKQCGKEGQVPFQPRNANDVLCAECFAAQKSGEAPAASKEDSGTEKAAESPAEG